MDKRRRQKIEENVLKLHDINEQISYYEDMLDDLETQATLLLSELYQDRPKEYIEDALVTVQEMQEKDKEEEFDLTLDSLICHIGLWLQAVNDSGLDERISRSEGKQLKNVDRRN